MSLSRRQDRRSLIRSVRGRLELTRRLAQGRTFAVHGVDDARLAVGGNNGDAGNDDVVDGQTSRFMRVERICGSESNVRDEMLEFPHAPIRH